MLQCKYYKYKSASVHIKTIMIFDGITNYLLLLKIWIYALLSRNNDICDSRTFEESYHKKFLPRGKLSLFPALCEGVQFHSGFGGTLPDEKKRKGVKW